MERLIANLLRDFEKGKMSRRELIQSLVLTATAASTAGAAPSPPGSGFKAIAVNHISYQVADYGRTRDFYVDLFGMGVTEVTTGRGANWVSATASSSPARPGSLTTSRASIISPSPSIAGTRMQSKRS